MREEVSKQLQHLERQAATAEKFTQLKAEERRLRAEVLALRGLALDRELAVQRRALAALENLYQAAVAGQRHEEAGIEEAREGQVAANEAFNEVQGRYYAAGAEVARVEQAIQFAKEGRRRAQLDLERVDQAFEQARGHRQHDEVQLAEITATLGAEAPRLDELRAAEARVAERLLGAEQALRDWQAEWDAFVQQAAEPTQLSQVERTRINHLEQQEQHWQRRIERLAEEKERLQAPSLEGEIRALDETGAEQRAQAGALAVQIAEAQARIAEARSAVSAGGHALDAARGRLQTARGRVASLEALQQAALGKQRGAASRWLEEVGLGAAPRLAERLEAEPAWQRAVESVLDHHLEAACADGLDRPAQALGRLSSGSVTLLDTRADDAGEALPSDSLLHRVQSPWPLRCLLGAVRCIGDVADALRRRDELSDGQSFVTPDGTWIGPSWLRAARGDEAHAGVLAREREIKSLAEEIGRLDEEAAAQQQRLAALRVSADEGERTRDALQRALDQANRALADTVAQLSGKRVRAEQLRHRAEAADREIVEAQTQIETGRRDLEAARERLHRALGAMESHAGQREQLLERRDGLRAEIDQLRADALRARNSGHEAALRVESLRTSERSLRIGLERTDGQLADLGKRRAELQEQLLAGEAPLAEQQALLESHLGTRLRVEGELAKARAALDAAEHDLRERDARRAEAERRVEAERGALESARLAHQEVVIRATTVAEQFAETGMDREEVARGLPADAATDAWQERLDRVASRIQRLGPINLAAIDEFKEQSERKAWLDAQHADVTASLETLEAAIHKIDRETRTRFRETFDRVNSGLQEMFPKLFGGGHAYLEMVGEELLDAGVAVMARPPGKRNSSIHLLSGGEKALTAVALVFAIFQLNPAPFCMLDEVDAPLDDANVGRFCELVKEMAEKVQFVFITHNKVTMEIANQLVGVTMHEPGVSRLVSVDVEEAARLAAV